MTRLFVDAREISPPPSTCSSLDDVIRHVESGHLPAEAVIRRIEVDGVPFDGSGAQPVAGFSGCGSGRRNRIEIFTGTLREVAADSIGEAVSYLDRIQSVTPGLATVFRSRPDTQAFVALRQLYEGFYWMNLLVARLEKSFGLTLEGIVVEGVSAREHHGRFLTILKQIVSAHERQDFIYIADLLEYEILPIVPIWKSMFLKLAGSC